MTNLDAHVLIADVSPLADAEVFSRALEKLSPTRRDKALAYKSMMQRQLSVGVALLLDRLLRRYGMRERDMEYSYNEHGKPAFTNAPHLRFSLSHSDKMVAAAMISTSHPTAAVGIDIQKLTPARDGVARRVFSAEDVQLLNDQLAGRSRDSLFTQLWTEYEAKGKASGIGITWDRENEAEHKFMELFPIRLIDYRATLCIMA